MVARNVPKAEVKDETGDSEDTGLEVKDKTGNSEGAGLEGRDIDGDSGDDSGDRDMDQSREEPESPIRLDLDMADWSVEALCKALWRRVER